MFLLGSVSIACGIADNKASKKYIETCLKRLTVQRFSEFVFSRDGFTDITLMTCNSKAASGFIILFGVVCLLTPSPKTCIIRKLTFYRRSYLIKYQLLQLLFVVMKVRQGCLCMCPKCVSEFPGYECYTLSNEGRVFIVGFCFLRSDWLLKSQFRRIVSLYISLRYWSRELCACLLEFSPVLGMFG
jgi:hypothetical protein